MYTCVFTFGLWLFLCIPSYLGQDAELLPLISNPLHRPFTMLWPTDAAFNALPEKRQEWLYRREHRDMLASYLKAHMIRDMKVNVTAFHSQQLYMLPCHTPSQCGCWPCSSTSSIPFWNTSSQFCLSLPSFSLLRLSLVTCPKSSSYGPCTAPPSHSAAAKPTRYVMVMPGSASHCQLSADAVC